MQVFLKENGHLFARAGRFVNGNNKLADMGKVGMDSESWLKGLVLIFCVRGQGSIYCSTWSYEQC